MPVEPHSTRLLCPRDFPPTTSISLKCDLKIEGLSSLRVTSGRLAVPVACAVLALQMTHQPDAPLFCKYIDTRTEASKLYRC